MTKKDLRTGDIIMNRAGLLGVVLTEKNCILYQVLGNDRLDDFDDNLIFRHDGFRECDIMAVYRDCNFAHVECYTPDYLRCSRWSRPDEAKRNAYKEKLEQKQLKRRVAEHFEQLRIAREERARTLTQEDLIEILAQQFYGNKTATEIYKQDINFFLKGILSPELFPGEDCTVDRKYIRLPHAEHIVVVYDQNQENRYVNVEFPELFARENQEYREHCGEDIKMHVSCEIPEIGFKIYTRCFACRINSAGEFESLQPEDYRIIVSYFPA